MDITLDYIGLTEAAEVASECMNKRTHTGTLRKAIARGDLPAVKFGREWIVSRAALQAWIDDPAMHVRGVKAK